jgi:alkanesulfonate monooxygenase SsuD/methylene tetrahydromethanopterin reductase-like flavin-dependent oxidoreductase (luciferase family)
MRFGVFIGPIFPGDLPGPDTLDLAIRLARTARESGFDGVFAAQHYVLGPSHQMLHPLLLLARLSAEFPGGYLGTSVYLLPFTHPVEAAESTALLDVMSGGRLILGVGKGYRATEFDSFGIHRSERGARLAEGVRAVRALWSGEPASFQGEFYSFDGVTIRPKPVQQPGPPIWVGSDTVHGVAGVPDYGDAWISSGRHTRTFIRSALPGYRARLDELGRPYGGVPMFREMHVAADSAQAEAEMRTALEALYQSYARWGQPGERYDQDFAELKRERILVGSPEEVADGVAEYRDEFAVPFMWFRLYFPGMDPELALDTIRMFGAEVIPRLRGTASG